MTDFETCSTCGSPIRCQRFEEGDRVLCESCWVDEFQN